MLIVPFLGKKNTSSSRLGGNRVIISCECYNMFKFQTLRSRVLWKYGNSALKVGVATMAGRRDHMEYRHLCVLELPDHPDVSLFAVFDGHGGKQCSDYLWRNVSEAMNSVADLDQESLIVSAFLQLDSVFLNDADDSGSTAVLVFVYTDPETNQPYKVRSAYVGDSFALLIRDGDFELLTRDHRPLFPAEYDRIRAAGGKVSDGRLNGHLSMSRGFGDSSHKRPLSNPPESRMLIALPEFVVMHLQPLDILVLGTDGVVESLTLKKVGDFVTKISSNEEPHSVASSLLTRSLGAGSGDNQTAIIIQMGDGVVYHNGAPELEMNAKDLTPQCQERLFDFLTHCHLDPSHLLENCHPKKVECLGIHDECHQDQHECRENQENSITGEVENLKPLQC